MTNERKCLACGRPLTGRQRKWCGRDDCGGWSDLYPEGKITCPCCGIEFVGNIGYHKTCYGCREHTSPCVVEAVCCKCGRAFRAFSKDVEIAVRLYCNDCQDSTVDEPKAEEDYAYVHVGMGYTYYGKPEGGNPRLKEIESRLGEIDVGEQEKEDLIKEAASLGQRIEVTWENIENKDTYLELLKRYKETGDNEHLIAAINLAPIAFVTSHELYNPKFCSTCGRITEWSTYGYCLTCDNPAKRSIELRTKLYREWSGDDDWEYNAGEFWLVGWELYAPKMHQMLMEGHSLSDVALKFNYAESTIRQRVREYCKAHNLESPWKRRIGTAKN